LNFDSKSYDGNKDLEFLGSLQMNGSWKKFGLLAGITSVALLYQNCALVSSPLKTPESEQAKLDASISLDQKAMGILATNCMGCHNAENPQGYLDVTNLNAMLYYRHIVPGEPGLSNIFYEVSQGNMPPRADAQLTQKEIDILAEWINTSFKGDIPNASIPTGPPLTPNFSIISSQIFRPVCNGCHSGNNPKGVRLDSYAGVMAVVTPGDSSTSRMYQAITGAPGVERMPQKGSLSAKQKEVIKTWIDNGALNN
jgi:mono/diheme cytochrome c family protein